MADITITDSLHAVANLKISDDSPFALSNLFRLRFNDFPVIKDFQKPIDQGTITQAAFGLQLGSPSALLADSDTPGSQTILQAMAGGNLFVRRASDRTVFADDGIDENGAISEIPIAAGECWIGLEIQASFTGGYVSNFDGFGVEVSGSSAVSLGTYVFLTPVTGALPTLQDALKTALDHYTVTRNAASIRRQRAGTVTTAGLTGTVTFSGSYSLPVNITPLASATLPFNYQVDVEPTETLSVTGEFALTGEFIVRSHKVSDDKVLLGVYKKKQTTFTVSFTAGAGIAALSGETDLLTAFLRTVVPKPNPASTGLTGDEAATLRAALRECLNQGLTVALNASCAASAADESALVYSIDLNTGNAADTDQAIASALRGEWSRLHTLPNAQPVCNIFTKLNDRINKMEISLLGILNYANVNDYLRTCTVVHDETGQILVIDKASASQVTGTGTPYAASADRVRSLLGQAFLATVTYAATGSKLRMKDFTVQQTYLKYKAKLSNADLRREVLLGRLLGLIANGNWDQVIRSNSDFDHARISITAHYGATEVTRLFFTDPTNYLAYTRDELERIGRDSRIALIDPDQENAPARIRALKDDGIWRAMDEIGNIAAFRTIDQLSRCSPTELADIAADWTDIRWWADAMLQVAPKLTQLFIAADRANTPDPTQNPAFMRNRKALEDALEMVAKNTNSAFGDGWGLIVMYNLSGQAAALDMIIGWNGKLQHYASPARVAAGRSTAS